MWDLNQLGGTECLLLFSGESIQGESQRKESRVVWKPHQGHNLPWMEGFRLSKWVKSTRSQDVLQSWQVLSHQSWDRYELSTYYDAGFLLSRERETSTDPASMELWGPQAKPVLFFLFLFLFLFLIIYLYHHLFLNHTFVFWNGHLIEELVFFKSVTLVSFQVTLEMLVRCLDLLF